MYLQLKENNQKIASLFTYHSMLLKVGIKYLEQGLQFFSVQDQITIILGFAGHTVSVVTTQLCCCGTKATTEHACV